MKAIKIKIEIDPQGLEKLNKYQQELTWLWDTLLANELHNHCLQWYKLAENKWGVDLTDCIRVPLLFGKNAWMGASCKIAIGGNYFKRDRDSKQPIKINGGYIQPLKLITNCPEEIDLVNNKIEIDRSLNSYQRIDIDEHQYRQVPTGKTAGRVLDKMGAFQNASVLNSLRELQGLEPISVPSVYIGGLVKQLTAALDAWKDPKLTARKKPLFKRDDLINSIQSLYPPLRINAENRAISLTGIGEARVIDRNYLKRLDLDNFVPRSYVLSKSASGYYLCISIATPIEADIPTLKVRTAAAKKAFGDGSFEHEEAREALANAKRSLDVEPLPHQLACGVDPGIRVVVANDKGALFNPSRGRERIAIHIEELQSRLDRLKDKNDEILGKKRQPTQSELKLSQKIARLHERGANNVKNFNHKLSTRLSRTYTDIAWEDTDLLSAIAKTQPQLEADGSYAKTGAGRDSDLNRRLAARSLGDLRAKTKQKLIDRGGRFYDPPAPNTSQLCHACGEFGDYDYLKGVFICKTNLCELHLQIQHGDVNAARNCLKIAAS